MKVILLDDVSGVGRKGDLLKVADGFARNYLIPKGSAMRASAGAERQAEQTRKTREIKEAQDLESAREIAGRLTDITLTLGARVSDPGKLYGSITAGDILTALAEQQNVTLEKSSLILENPIREMGTHQVRVSPHADVSFNLSVEVVAVD